MEGRERDGREEQYLREGMERMAVSRAAASVSRWRAGVGGDGSRPSVRGSAKRVLRRARQARGWSGVGRSSAWGRGGQQAVVVDGDSEGRRMRGV